MIRIATRAGLLFIAAVATAQDISRPLTWQECVDIAARQNPELAASTLDVEAGRATYYGSYNGILPKLSLSNSYSDSSSAGAAASRWQAQANASVSLFDINQIAGIKSASAQLTQAEAELQESSSLLRFDLKRAYAQLLFVQDNVQVSRAILELREKSSQLVALRYNSGRESLGNMLRSKAQLLQAQTELAQAQRQVRTAQRTLLRVLGQDGFSVVAATGTLAAAPPPEFPVDSRAMAAARPDIAAQEASVKRARADVTRASGAYWPSLTANYNRTRSGPSEFPNARYAWSAGGALSFPLFSGGPTAAFFESRASRRGLASAERRLRAARDQAAVEVESSWAGYAAAVDQARVRAALLEASRQRNAEADVRYASGLVSYDNWEIIASDRINSERQAVQAKLDAVNAQTAWERALGMRLER